MTSGQHHPIRHARENGHPDHFIKYGLSRLTGFPSSGATVQVHSEDGPVHIAPPKTVVLRLDRGTQYPTTFHEFSAVPTHLVQWLLDRPVKPDEDRRRGVGQQCTFVEMTTYLARGLPRNDPTEKKPDIQQLSNRRCRGVGSGAGWFHGWRQGVHRSFCRCFRTGSAICSLTGT